MNLFNNRSVRMVLMLGLTVIGAYGVYLGWPALISFSGHQDGFASFFGGGLLFLWAVATIASDAWALFMMSPFRGAPVRARVPNGWQGMFPHSA